MTTTTPQYKIPADMLAWVTDVPSVVVYRGVYVNTADSYTSYPPDESLCALCDGCRKVTCATCDGQGALVATERVWDEDDQTYYDEDVESQCPRCGGGSLRCPQSRARWCHDVR
jgi:hypothetical protein